MTLLPLLMAVGAARAAAGVFWNQTSTGPWGAREGLMGVSVGSTIYMSGGRGTGGIGFANDVWKTEDGVTWTPLGNAPWARRSYHIMLELNNCVFVMGGQDFLHFYNDVWKMCDGKTWELVTKNAPWPGRAGLGGTVFQNKLVIAGGCFNRNNNPAQRDFYGDVWSSEDGVTWTELNSTAWPPRSGPRLVVMKEKLFLIAGETGFTPPDQLADIYSSADGVTWDLVTTKPGWSPRSGHGVVVHKTADAEMMLVIAGWPNLHDAYISPDGANFKLINNATWNCNSYDCGKFDFWSLEHQGKLFLLGGSGAYSTFGHLYDETWEVPIAQYISS